MMNLSHLLSCSLLIPAGLVGIGAGLHEMWLAADTLPAFFDHLRQISDHYQPWIEGLVSLFAGALLLFIASLLGLRGLQS
jgi:hypothetical protein